ncbi:YL1 nuclear protein C-terminal domain-containing protein [Schizophyllum commune]
MAASSGSLSATCRPARASLGERLSFLHYPKPFKNPKYTKNSNRRTKNIKAILNQERERDKVELERLRAEKMDVDGASPALAEDIPTYASIEAPPSVLPQGHYCDITGLEAPYTDPATGLRYHDKAVYQMIKGLTPSTAKEYLSARGVNSIVK